MTIVRNQPRLARFALSFVTYGTMSFMDQCCTNITLVVADYDDNRASANIPWLNCRFSQDLRTVHIVPFGLNKTADDVVAFIHAKQDFVARIAFQLGAKVGDWTQ